MPLLLRELLSRLTHDWLLLVLLATFPLALWLAPWPKEGLVRLVDWKTISALAGLMILSRGLEISGLIDRVGRRVVFAIGSLRGLACGLVLLAAILSMIVTNDVALFVTVPLTLGLARLVTLPVGRLVIFQALAVNAGSALSPVGNPQNLFLWQASGAGFMEFVLAMLPLAGVMFMLVLALVPLGFGASRLRLSETISPLPLQRSLMTISLVAYPFFLWAVNSGLALPGMGLILAVFIVRFRHVLHGLDWGLLLVFVLMFINMRLLGHIPKIEAMAVQLLDGPQATFALGAGLSQAVSNVPAAIFLATFTEDWRALAWGVNAGGFGLIIGSLANIIALRLCRQAGNGQAGLWWEFHLWSLPMLMFSMAAGVLLLAG